MTDENPYAPPKSNDFRLSENNKKPSKWRVFWWIYSLSFVLIPVSTLIPFFTVYFLFDKYKFYEMLNMLNTSPLFLLFVMMFLIVIAFVIYVIPTSILLFIIQYRIKNFKEKVIYSLINGVLIFILMDFIYSIIFNEVPYEDFIELMSGIFGLIGYMIAIYFIVKKVNYRILNYS